MLSPTLVQKFFLKVFSAWERERRQGGSGKPLVTLTFNLTFMQMIAVKRVKVTNGNIANTCLSAATFFLLGVDRKNASLSLRKRLSFVAQWDFRPQKTSPRKPRSKFLLLFMSIWSLPCSRAYYMYYVCSILQSIFLKQNFTSRTAVRDILTIPSVVSIKGTDQIDCRVYSSISSLRASSPIWANLRSGLCVCVFFFQGRTRRET